MAEVKWQARRVSDGVLVDVTGDTTGTPAGAPVPNALEGGQQSLITAGEPSGPDGLATVVVDASGAAASITGQGMSPDGNRSGAVTLTASNIDSTSAIEARKASGSTRVASVNANVTSHATLTLEAFNADGGDAALFLSGQNGGVHLGFDVTVPGFFTGSADPSAASGVAAPLGSLYLRSGTAQLWLKTSAPNTGWTRMATV